MKRVNEKIFTLWGKVLNKDKKAKKEFVKIYKEVFPDNGYLYKNPNDVKLHIMYIHLYNK